MPTMIVLDSGVPPSVLTPEDMTPIMDSVAANIGVLLPIVLGLAAVFIGIKIVRQRSPVRYPRRIWRQEAPETAQ